METSIPSNFSLDNIKHGEPQRRPFAYSQFIRMSYAQLKEYAKTYKASYPLLNSKPETMDDDGHVRKHIRIRFKEALKISADLLLVDGHVFSVTLTGLLADADKVELDIHHNIEYSIKDNLWNDTSANTEWRMHREDSQFVVVVTARP